METLAEQAKMKILDFVVIGAPKAGTTSLFHYLRFHPSIYLPPEKEAPLFSNQKRYTNGWNDYAKEFFSRASSSSLWGKVTPQYMEFSASEVPERMFRMMPQIKLIALLRNPIDRAFSHYRMEVRLKREHLSFETRLQSKEDLNSKLYFTTSLYGQILERYLRFFPANQLLLHFTDDLEQRPTFVLDSILRHLGLEAGYIPANLQKRYHVGGKQKIPFLYSLARNAGPLYSLYKSIPLRHRRVLSMWLKFQGNVAPEQPSAIEPEFRRMLVEFYKADVTQLENILGIKVPWKEFGNR